MAGRIQRDSIAQVRDRARIDEVVGAHVTLCPAGIDSLKGLCPFHDERTPSFHVRPSAGYWHCFGCGEGGDVFAFVQKIDHLSFSEAVAYLADRYRIHLEYEEGGGQHREETPGRRQRLLEAHRIAEEYYRRQLDSPAAATARKFLTERDFSPETAAHFGIGYAPAGWDNLLSHLRNQGFTEPELAASGLVTTGNRGAYDRFRDRLMWPIRDLTGATVGFGARQLSSDDKGAKYLNSPETAIYKKSQVLYGLDLAKKEIARSKRIVVVEGYTDVMAAHLAGIGQAVATCGTAFGSDHARIVRRLIGDSADPAAGVILASGQAHGGEIIFTFDGDEAGKKAALRAFAEDQSFASQTFVAIDRNGMDPCDLRLARGDEAVRKLVETREPLFAFVIRTALANCDLTTVEGRVGGLRATAPVVAGIRDRALRREYSRELAGWLSMDEAEVRQAVARAARAKAAVPRQEPTPVHRPRDGADATAGGQRGSTGTPTPPGQPVSGDQSSREAAGDAPRSEAPRPPAFGPPPGWRGTREDHASRVERLALQAVLAEPQFAIGSGFDRLRPEAFAVPAYRAVFEVIKQAGGVGTFQAGFGALLAAGVADAQQVATSRWNESILAEADELVARVLTALAVQPLPHDRADELRAFVLGVINALERTDLGRQTAHLSAQLQRTDPSEDSYQQVFAKLMEVEARRRALSAVESAEF